MFQPQPTLNQHNRSKISDNINESTRVTSPFEIFNEKEVYQSILNGHDVLSSNIIVIRMLRRDMECSIVENSDNSLKSLESITTYIN